jgi:nucleotide-binding universal stress UspA family protein
MSTVVSDTGFPESQSHARRVLVCLDRSPCSESCIPYAVSLAKTFGSRITLVTVLQLHEERKGPQTNDALSWEISRQEANGYLERLQIETSQATGQVVDIRIEQGRPAERIIDLARELGADLTLLGSVGEGGATAKSLGGTAQQVLAEGRGSLFIVHPSSMVAKGIALKRILVPLDGSLRTESVLPVVARIATTHGAELLLVHVVQEPVLSALLPAGADMDLARELANRLESLANKYLERLQQQLAREVPAVRTLVFRHPSAHQSLLDISRKEQIDLIVLSAHGSACDSSLPFGCVTAFLLMHSLVPLLVLQDVGERDPSQAETAERRSAPPSPRASYAAESA